MTDVLSAEMGVPDAPKFGGVVVNKLWSKYQLKPSSNEQAHQAYCISNAKRFICGIGAARGTKY